VLPEDGTFTATTALDAQSRGLTKSQDVHVYLFPLADGTTEVILKLVQRWTKNNKDLENSVYVLPVLIPFDTGQDRGSSL
jgi:hypothetical protein